MGTSIGDDLTRLLTRAQPKSISSHLHYCWVYRGQIIIENNNRDTKEIGPSLPLGHTQTSSMIEPKLSMKERSRFVCLRWPPLGMS